MARRVAQRLEQVCWHVAMCPGLRPALDKAGEPSDALAEKIDVKVRYRGLVRNTAQFETLFALSNLWMPRHVLMARARPVRA